MGHAIDYITCDRRDDIWSVAEEFAIYNVDRGENPTGDYHGNLTIHDDIICESYEDAYKKIEELDNGWYDDHAVRFKDKRALQPTKQMLAEKARAEKLVEDRMAYEDKHSIKARKSEFIGCKGCNSKLSIKHLRGNRCPVCGEELRADYVVERIEKYHTDYKKSKEKYEELQKKQKGKCPTRWLVKVEVHC